MSGGQFTLWPEAELAQAALDFCHPKAVWVHNINRGRPPGDLTWRTEEPWARSIQDQVAINSRYWPPGSSAIDRADRKQIEMEFYAKHPNQPVQVSL